LNAEKICWENNNVKENNLNLTLLQSHRENLNEELCEEMGGNFCVSLVIRMLTG
jgi:hypothetical protein